MSNSPKKLRVGLLLGSTRVSAWVARMVDLIRADGHAEIVLLIVDASPPAPPAAGMASRFRRDPKRTLQQMFRRVLEMLIQRIGQGAITLPDAFAPVDLAAQLPSVPQVSVVPTRTLWSDRFSDSEIAAIRMHEVDVLIRIGFRILRGDILKAARHGVWSFHHGDNDVNRGGPPGYWESMESWPTTGCTLQVLSEDLDNGQILDKTWAGTITSSVMENNRSTYWKSLSMIPRQLGALHRIGAERYFANARAAFPHPQWYSSRLYRSPDNAELLRLLGIRFVRRIKRALEARLGFDQWIMLVHSSQSLSMSLWRYKRLTPPKDRFWADPFLLVNGGRTWLYFEELMFATQRGHISVAELKPDGTMLEPQRALVTDHHLSYPFVFQYEGGIYMVPESRGDRCVPLYRCVEMPHRWEKVGNLMDDVDAVDATLHFHDGRWWMFVNMIVNRGASSCDELFLFHADNPLGREWTPHPMNPIVSDARRARPAGKLFVHDGRLYRPSQDCSHRYGWGLNLNWVETISPVDYVEHLVSRAEPGWAPDVRATHTFNREGPLHVVDAEIRRSRWV